MSRARKDCLAVSAPACSSSGAIPTIAVAGRRASSPSPVDHGIRLRLLARGPHRRTNGARTRAVGSLLPCVPACPRLQCLNPGRPSCVRVRTASKFPPVRSIRPSFGHPPPSPPNNVAPAFATPASSTRSVPAAPAGSNAAAVSPPAAQCRTTGRRSRTAAVAVALRDVPALCLRTTLSSPRTASIPLRPLLAAAAATAVPPRSGPTGATARRTPDPHALPLEDARLAGTSRPSRRRPRARLRALRRVRTELDSERARTDGGGHGPECAEAGQDRPECGCECECGCDGRGHGRADGLDGPAVEARERVQHLSETQAGTARRTALSLGRDMDGR